MCVCVYAYLRGVVCSALEPHVSFTPNDRSLSLVAISPPRPNPITGDNRNQLWAQDSISSSVLLLPAPRLLATKYTCLHTHSLTNTTHTKEKKTCPSRWSMFSCSCYLLSERSGSWDEGRKDCRNKGADLVVIESPEEQNYLITLTQNPTWIGLNDKEEEGKWKWIDGTPLTLKYWESNQPDNGAGDTRWGEEDCAHIRTPANTLWNDRSCGASLHWVCEKMS
uniref:C-type lectin domain-containing protein n=1 Tax=Pundamilia nyererei TaxID=303518 RepID=A0A3B4FSX2_9CICH